MSNTNANFEMTGILLGQEARKRKTPQEKIAIIQQTMEPGMDDVALRKLAHIEEDVLAHLDVLVKDEIRHEQASARALGPLDGQPLCRRVVAQLRGRRRQARELQRLLGKKTMEVEILKEAVEYGQSRKWIAHAPLLPKDGE